jgi:hypothetical protein
MKMTGKSFSSSFEIPHFDSDELCRRYWWVRRKKGYAFVTWPKGSPSIVNIL